MTAGPLLMLGDFNTTRTLADKFTNTVTKGLSTNKIN